MNSQLKQQQQLVPYLDRNPRSYLENLKLITIVMVVQIQMKSIIVLNTVVIGTCVENVQHMDKFVISVG